MNDFFKNIDRANHIEIVAEIEFLPHASALYTHMLRLHKKVSLVCLSENIDKKFSFLPWFEKIKSTRISSADMRMVCDFSAKSLYDFFMTQECQPNKKMATALYAALICETNGFRKELDGTIFAMAGVLIELGADSTRSTRFLLQRTTLSYLRLKASMLKKMLLQNDAKVAIFFMHHDDLLASGANHHDAFLIMQEALDLEYVEVVILLESDKENELKKIIYKEI